MRRRLNPKSKETHRIVAKYMFSRKPDTIVYIFWFSLLLLLLNEFVFKSFPARDIGFIPRTLFVNAGVFFPNIFYSIVSAFIFYLIVVYIPLEKKKANAAFFFDHKSSRIYNETRYIALALYRTAKIKSNDPNKFLLSEEEISNLSTYINPQSRVDIPGAEVANWDSYLMGKTNIIHRNIQDILACQELLSEELFAALTEVDRYCDQLNSLIRIGYGRQSLSSYSKDLHYLFKAVYNLLNISGNIRRKYY